MRVIYADTLFVINFAVNYLILLATAKISAVCVKRLKLALAAAFGGAYAIAAALMTQSFVQSLGFKVAAALIMLLICFGGRQGLLRTALIFLAVSAAFGGVVLAVSYFGGSSTAAPVSLKTLIPSFALSYAVMALVFRRLGRERPGGFVHIKLEYGGRTIDLTALVDTGNTLTDPLSGRGIVVAEVESVAELFEKSAADVLRNELGAARQLEALGGCGHMLRLVPYSAVGVPRGMLLAFRPGKIIIDGKDKTGMLVAISPTRLSEGGVYSAVIGGRAPEVTA